MALPEPSRLTEKEYLALECVADVRHEFIDGYVYAMVGASPNHIDISVNLTALLQTALRGRPCRVMNSDMRVKVEKFGNYYYPDISVVCGERRLAEDSEAATLLNPTLIIEVLSPSTAYIDRTTKFEDYRQIESLRDYVLVSQGKALIECYSRAEDGTWILRDANGRDATLRLPSVDVELALAAVYENVTFEKAD